jgi:hypothetical protein
MKKEENKTKLLWVKIPEVHAIKLKETADKIGVSRADFMRLILINFVSNDQNTLVVQTAQTK